MGALLFVRSLRNLTTLNVGFQQTGNLGHQRRFRPPADPRGALYRIQTGSRQAAWQAIPGVESAAHAMLVPFGGSTWNDGVLLEGSDQEGR